MIIIKWVLIVIALVVLTGLLAGQLGLLKGTPPPIWAFMAEN